MKLPENIKIIEIGPRDGLQNEATFLETKNKIELIKQLVECGFKEIEATSFVHPRAIPNLADAEEVIDGIREQSATFFALVPNEKGYERAIKIGIHGITFVLSATDSHSKKNLNRSTKDSIKELSSLVEHCQKDNRLYRASVSTVFGCPFEGQTEFGRIAGIVESLAKIGFKRVGLCDTIGVANPSQVYQWMTKLTNEFKQLEFELHFHDTYGRGLANVLAGIQAGVFSFDSSIGGLGGCPYAPGATGNISTEDVVDLLEEMKINTGIDKRKLLNTSHTLEGFIHKQLNSQIWKVNKSKCL
ncbi:MULTISPECIES: hydroxymethylglutaryl-CoA lyase [Robertmurraya]|uniref:Hydroxymethylglutaryl-CoA lyase n=1 Tax=Robertmurraya beringensis TaxID=641660 RepID=A0ABV6KQB6_9BACI